MTDLIREHGWTPQPRDPITALRKTEGAIDPAPQALSNINFPVTPLCVDIMKYAKKELPEATFNHSMRVYYYGNSGAVAAGNLVLVVSKAHALCRQSDTDSAISRVGLLR